MRFIDLIFRRTATEPKATPPVKTERTKDLRASWTIKGDSAAIHMARSQLNELQARFGHRTQFETLGHIIRKAHEYYARRDATPSVEPERTTPPVEPRKVLETAFAAMPALPRTNLSPFDEISSRIELCGKVISSMNDVTPYAVKRQWEQVRDANSRIKELIESGVPMCAASGTLGIKICDAHYYRPNAGTMKLQGSKKWKKAKVKEVLEAAACS